MSAKCGWLQQVSITNSEAKLLSCCTSSAGTYLNSEVNCKKFYTFNK